MKTLKNILGIILLILAIWANARANSLTMDYKITSVEPFSAKELKVDAYVVNDILHVDFDQAQTQKIHVEIYDITGKRTDNFWLPIKIDTHREMELTEHLKSGLYIIKVSAGKEVSAIKLQV